MRKHSKISGMHLITCDHLYDIRYPGEGPCGLEFRTCSDKSVINEQLGLAGWSQRDVMEGSKKVKQDLCAHHTKVVNNRMSYAQQQKGDDLSGSRFGKRDFE